MFFNKITF